MTATTEKFGSIGDFESILDDSFVFKGLKKQDYPQFVTKTIRLLGQNSGLRLLFSKSASGACFNPETKVVTIPTPPAFPKDSATKAEKEAFTNELARWRGVLNHEVGHAQFTLWKASPKVKKITREDKMYPIDHHMFNDLFENGRMERVACDQYPGMIRDLQKLEGFLSEIITEIYEKDPKNFNHIYYALRMVVNGYEPCVAIPDDLKEDWEVVREMAKEAWETDDEEETYKIAQKVAAYLKKRYEEEQEKKGESEDKEQDLKEELEALEELKEALENAMEDDQIGDGADGEGDEGEPKEGDKGEEGSDGEGEGSPSSVQMPWEKEKGKKKASLEISEDKEDEKESEDDKENEGEGKGEGSDSKEEEGKEDSKESEGEGKDGEDKEDEKSKEDKISELEKEIEKKKKEIAETLKDKMNIKVTMSSLDLKDIKEVDPTKEYEVEHKDLDESTKGGEVIPLPLHDYVVNVEVEAPEHSKQTKKILDECMGQVAGMAQRFIQKVRSRVHVGVRTYKGRVNRRKLHRYKYDSNIFKTQNLRKKKDAAVMIIVDCSGSMGGGKIDTARKAALVIGEMMNRAKVEFEIRGFTVPYSSDYDIGCFTRQSDLIHYRFGGSRDWHHSQHNVVEGKLEYGLQDNDDGESMRHFADEIAQSKKDSKIMVVISDGQPSSCAQGGNTDKDLKKVIPEIRQTGTDVYAIGLDTDVQKYYGEDKSVRLSSYASTTEIVEAIGQFVNQITMQ